MDTNIDEIDELGMRVIYTELIGLLEMGLAWDDILFELLALSILEYL